MIRSLDKRVERMGRAIPAVSLLRTVPGIGPYRALLIATEAMPIERFHKPAHLVEVWHGESTSYREKSELQETHVAPTTSRFD